MPLRDDLLDPIAGENPSGPDLRYDPVFDQIKEARRQDDDSMPAGDWERAVKKADFPLVVKLAGQTLAKRTKDLRLATYLIEAQYKLEGVGILAPALAWLRTLQETFWETLHPEIEDGDLELRTIEVERVARQICVILKEIPLTRSGLTPADYDESRMVGYEDPNASYDKQQARTAAIEAGKMSAEAFDKAAALTPKAYFVQTRAALDAALEETEKLDSFQREAYGDQYPQVSNLTDALQLAVGYVNAMLNERRKTEPDAVAAIEVVEQWHEEAVQSPPFVLDESPAPEPVAFVPAPQTVAAAPPRSAGAAPATLSQPEDAYALVVRSALFLFEADAQSPVPYLVCAGLRLGETRMQGESPEAGFAVGPRSETRQALRALAVQGDWSGLLKAALPVLAEPCGRAWLDLHRYLWRAARESNANGLAAAVVSTLRGVLAERPELRHWTLEDDTAAANPETQAWLDAEVLPPAPAPEAAPAQEIYIPAALPAASSNEDGETDAIYETAQQLLQNGRPREAISMMVRDAESQSSGRMRFRRRLQLAQMCITAGHAEVARAVLEDLAQEIDRRKLENWESGELLAAPLALLLKCMEGKPDTNGARDALFHRLCLLDPKAALLVGF
jgi:type VI secretion system protein ImpA